MTTDRIGLSIANGVADVRLNRPDKLNALDPAMFTAIADAGAQLADNPKVRAVVLLGEGQAFCTGLDMERLVATTEGSAFGGGFQLMLGADIRYLAPATRLAIGSSQATAFGARGLA
ncbi:enoyl-CoA hydratase/isomerase family protein [Bradyrhizobium sp. 41S5]|uniref:enoyl-CoA hydratase-related protein n=1 Tax=Bradyrhizobium sp. 41S5 TaxID=1404443 RepID=UPI001E63AB8C|nr:enoyl-CoA hydratase-related protein [Bradyrhizobium sp. 41S5]UFX45271.1 enoyl-CoA hydratase/isomerase family protein [Bradyrhizobium sp. 41S5]